MITEDELKEFANENMEKIVECCNAIDAALTELGPVDMRVVVFALATVAQNGFIHSAMVDKEFTEEARAVLTNLINKQIITREKPH